MIYNTIFLFGMPGMGELLLIGVILFFFFGAKKIPELMKGLGQGIGEFKKGMSGEGEEDKEVGKIEQESTKHAGSETTTNH
ncbi:twin-arginine translocase TatA/TatE family subunit [Cytophagaceae bacterium ABcell3]|nr:twin-arginine translocase TatA/TatE family subunit [Cytophagaceae bacterium ABcell3]